MALHNLTITALVGNSVPFPEHTYFEVRPKFQWVSEDESVNWPVPVEFDFVDGVVTIPRMEDTDKNGDPVSWEGRTVFEKRGQNKGGGEAVTFEFNDDAPTDAIFPRDVHDVVIVSPGTGPSYLVETKAYRDETEVFRDQVVAVGTTNDTIIAGRINDPTSATTTALNATIAAQVGSISSEVLYTSGAWVPGSKIRPLVQDRSAVLWTGSSLSKALSGVMEADMAALGWGMTVLRFNGGGERTWHTLAQLDIAPPEIVFPGNIIPASGTVDVTVNVFGWGNYGMRSYETTCQGVRGVFARVSSTQFTWTRVTPGTAVTLTGPVLARASLTTAAGAPQGAYYLDKIAILDGGKNNLPLAGTPEQAFAAILAQWDALVPKYKKVIVLGWFNNRGSSAEEKEMGEARNELCKTWVAEDPANRRFFDEGAIVYGTDIWDWMNIDSPDSASLAQQAAHEKPIGLEGTTGDYAHCGTEANKAIMDHAFYPMFAELWGLDYEVPDPPDLITGKAFSFNPATLAVTDGADITAYPSSAGSFTGMTLNQSSAAYPSKVAASAALGGDPGVLFEDAANEYIRTAANAVAIGQPFTYGIKLNCHSVAGRTVYRVISGQSDQYQAMRIDGPASATPGRVRVGINGDSSAFYSIPITFDEEHAIIWCVNGANSWLQIDNGPRETFTLAAAPGGQLRVALGTNSGGTAGQNFVGVVGLFEGFTRPLTRADAAAWIAL